MFDIVADAAKHSGGISCIEGGIIAGDQVAGCVGVGHLRLWLWEARKPAPSQFYPVAPAQFKPG
jgi:hypothetical protein